MDLNGLKNGPENLECRNGVYYIRMRVPKDVQDQFGRTTIRESLRLKDRYKAKIELSRRLVAINEEFERLRANEPNYTKVLTRREAAQMAHDWTLQQLQRVQLEPAQTELSTGRDQSEIDTEMHELADLLRELQLGGGEASNNEVERHIHQLLLNNGFPEEPVSTNHSITPSIALRANVDTDTSQYAFLKRSVEEGLKSIWRATLAKHNGQTRIDAALNPIMPGPVSGEQIELAEMLRQFKAQKESESYGKRKLLAYNVVSEIMVGVFGPSTLMDDVTNQDCRRFIHVLRNIPRNARKRFGDIGYVEAAQLALDQKLDLRAATTIQGDINSANAIFNWAINQGMLTKNPMPRRSFPKRNQTRPDEQRLPFSADDLTAIFSAPLFTRPTGQTHGAMKKTPARFWIPLLALFHGCRLNELCQLQVSDVRSESGIPYLAIRDADHGSPGQLLKTQWSRRDIPLHPNIQELGFMDFVEATRAAGHTRLFPELTLCGRGYYSSRYQKWFSRFLVQTGVKRQKISFHSFRHTFKNATRDIEIPLDVTRRLGGWKLNEVHERYGQYTVAVLARHANRIEYVGLDLSGCVPP